MTPERRPKAYSYTRFSSPEQAQGDSLRRQTEAAREYAARHNLDLDETLTFHDPSMSAYWGLNAEAGELGTFLEALKDKIIPQGSYLLVESLDRVSRQTVRKAVRTMEDIVAAGVNLVDLSDGGRLYSIESLDSDQMSFLLMAIRFMRAHEESAVKSRRLLAVYEPSEPKRS
jgi:DNA invertase Pin-like site-specific DNA recombinase